MLTRVGRCTKGWDGNAIKFSCDDHCTTINVIKFIEEKNLKSKCWWNEYVENGNDEFVNVLFFSNCHLRWYLKVESREFPSWLSRSESD